VCYDWGMSPASTLQRRSGGSGGSGGSSPSSPSSPSSSHSRGGRDSRSRSLLRFSAGLLLAALLATLLGACMNFQKAQQTADRLNAAQRETADELFNAAEYEQALDAYSQVLAAYPADSYAYGQRAECYRMLSRYDEAIADFTRALELAPENSWALACRGESYRSKGQYDLAIQDLDQSLRLQPDYAWALSSRGDAWRLQDQYDKALADFNRAIELDPNYEWALARRGETYRMKSDFTRSLADLDQAIGLAPGDSFPYASRGQVYKQTGEPEKALADFDKAIEIDPQYQWAKDRRAELLAEMSGEQEEPEPAAAAAAAPAAAVRPAAARPAGPLPLITVLDFAIENMAKSDGRLIVDLVFSALVSSHKYRVLDRGQRDNILKEVEFSLSACTDEKCQLEVGRLLAADKIVVGSLGKVGQRYILNAKMLDVRTGEALASAYKVFPSLEDLVDGAEQVALSLSETES
jgi:tetratricopeptide (TPR) repeat protein